MRSLEQPSHEPKKEIAASQENIDAVYASLARYENGGEVFGHILLELLEADGMKVTNEDLQAGEITHEGSNERQYLEVDVSDFSQRTGDIFIHVRIEDTFNPIGRQKIAFKKTYHLKASPEAVQRHSDVLARDQEERVAKAAEFDEKVREALPVLRKFASGKFGMPLSAKEWRSGEHGFLGLYGGEEHVPEGSSWAITEEAENRLRITFKNAEGVVQDVIEFGPER